MPPPNRAGSKKYYPQFPTDIHASVKDEARLVRDALYNLREKQINVVQLTLSSNSQIDATLTANSPTLFIVSQNAIGGWTPNFTTNQDGSLKFLGTTAIAWTTTANTYTALLFWATSTTKSYLVSYLSGGNLA